MEDSLSGAVKELHSLVSLLSQENLTLADDSRLQELGDRLLGLLEGFPRQSEHALMRGHFSSIHASAVTLWNLAVAFRASGNTRKSFIAQLRHVSLGLVLLSEPPSPHASHLKKLLAMSLKTARSWLDADNFVMADAAIVHGWEQADRLIKCVGADAEAAAVVSASKVRLLACKSEAWLGLSEQERALDCIGQAKQLLPHVSQSERAWVSVLCYNLGLGLYKGGAHSQCMSWLKESYEIGRQSHCMEAVKQARTLRLIALAYLECDVTERDWMKSLNTVELSLTEHVHPSGLFLKLRVLLQGREASGGQEMQIRSSLLDLIRCPDTESDLCLTAVRMTADTAGLSDLAFLALSAVREFHSSPAETNKCALLQLELLLRVDRLEEGLELLSGAEEFGFDADKSKRLIVLIWDQATRLVETGRHHQALVLYDHCINRYSSCGLGETNLAKLHRNRAVCLMELGKLEEAQSAFQAALNFGPSSPYTHYIGYKLAILLDKSALAGEHLSNMISSHRGATHDNIGGDVTIQGLLSLSVQVAFESGNKHVACSALEQLVYLEEHATCDSLSALRCLVRLKLTLMEAAEESVRAEVRRQVVKLVETAFLQLRKKGGNQQEDISLEVSWFSKVAWNLALQCQTDYSAMKQFFSLSMRLNNLSPLDPSVESRQKSCLVGASASALKHLKGLTEEREIKSVAEEVLGFVEQGKRLCGRGSDSSLVFFHLFEFEAKHKLGYQNLGKCLEEIALLPSSDSKMFEAIASIASNGNTHSKRLAVKSLQLCLERLKTSENSLDMEKQAQIHHSLISILLSNEMLIDTAGRENALSTFKQILNLLLEAHESNGKQRYPEIDIVWLMTKCWNLGVIQYSKQQFVEAEIYCGLALKFLYQLNDMKSSYEAQMTDVYSEILTKLPDSSDCIISQQPEP